jgi:Xaa-Pro dipeptidase
MLFNRTRALEYMRRYGLDALVATSPINITYFTDYFNWTDALFKGYMTSPGAPPYIGQGYAVFPLEGEPALVVGPFTAVNAGDIWVRDLRVYGDSGLDFSLHEQAAPESVDALYGLLRNAPLTASPTAALVGALRDRGLLQARIGIEMEGVTPPSLQELRQSLPHASLKDSSNLIRLIRAVKSPEEIERLTRSAQINEQAGMAALELAQPGAAALDLVQAYRQQVGALGADVDHFAYGVDGKGIGTEVDYRFRENDVLFVDFGCNYRHYFSDTGTTLAIGTPSSVLRERFAAARASMDAGVELIRPGVLCSTVRGAMMKALNVRGITAANPHGHGFGLDVRDYPIVVADNGLRIRDEFVDVPSDLPLEVDMVINLEVPIFTPGIGSVHTEQSFVVTADGSRPLIPQARLEFA